MNRFLRTYLIGMVFTACLFAGSPSFGEGNLGPLFFSSVNSVWQENSYTGAGTYQLTINGKIKDKEIPILLSLKNINLNNTNHRAIMDFCEKSALLAMNNPGRYLLSVSGVINATAGEYFVDFSSNDRTLCKVSTPN